MAKELVVQKITSLFVTVSPDSSLRTVSALMWMSVHSQIHATRLQLAKILQV